MTKDEAIKLALEALENVQYYGWGQTERDYDARTAAITALREALAEQPAQQEPVAFLDWYDNAHWGNEDFKAGCWRAWDAALAQRTWVGLSYEDIEIAFDDTQEGGGFDDFARAIEAKLRSKNT
jgi:hypothetical protein